MKAVVRIWSRLWLVSLFLEPCRLEEFVLNEQILLDSFLPFLRLFLSVAAASRVVEDAEYGDVLMVAKEKSREVDFPKMQC